MLFLLAVIEIVQEIMFLTAKILWETRVQTLRTDTSFCKLPPSPPSTIIQDDVKEASVNKLAPSRSARCSKNSACLITVESQMNKE